jgi:hypothetical protein
MFAEIAALKSHMRDIEADIASQGTAISTLKTTIVGLLPSPSMILAAGALEYVDQDFRRSLSLDPLDPSGIRKWAKRYHQGMLSRDDLARWKTYTDVHPQILDRQVFYLYDRIRRGRNSFAHPAEAKRTDGDKLMNAIKAVFGSKFSDALCASAAKLVALVDATPVQNDKYSRHLLFGITDSESLSQSAVSAQNTAPSGRTRFQI